MLAFSLAALSAAPAQNDLSIGLTAGRPEIRLKKSPVAPLAGTPYRFLLEGTSDFRNWTPEGELAAGAGAGLHFIPPGVAPHRVRHRSRIADFRRTKEDPHVGRYFQFQLLRQRSCLRFLIGDKAGDLRRRGGMAPMPEREQSQPAAMRKSQGEMTDANSRRNQS